MLLIILSALASVSVALLLKKAVKRGFDAGQLITWNYLSAVCASFYFFSPSLEHLAQLPWLTLLLLGTLLPSIFLALSWSLRDAGLVRTEVAQRLSLLISLAFAFLWFGETVTTTKVAGLSLGLIAIVVLITNRASGQSQPAITPLLLVWVGYAAIDILLKTLSQQGVALGISLFFSFLIAFGWMSCWQLVRHLRNQTTLSIKHCWLGLGMGTLNFANIALYVLAHRNLADSPAVVFAMMNILVVVMGTIAGTLIFKERLKLVHWVAIATALCAIGLLALR